MRFGKRGKFNPRYRDPDEIFQNYGKVSYELWLPSEVTSVHLVFHVSMIKKCIGDPDSILHTTGLGADENLSNEKILMEIFNRSVKKLRYKDVASIKVLWRNHLVERETLEVEADSKSRYPHLFTN